MNKGDEIEVSGINQDLWWTGKEKAAQPMKGRKEGGSVGAVNSMELRSYAMQYDDIEKQTSSSQKANTRKAKMGIMQSIMLSHLISHLTYLYKSHLFPLPLFHHISTDAQLPLRRRSTLPPSSPHLHPNKDAKKKRRKKNSHHIHPPKMNPQTPDQKNKCRKKNMPSRKSIHLVVKQ